MNRIRTAAVAMLVAAGASTLTGCGGGTGTFPLRHASGANAAGGTRAGQSGSLPASLHTAQVRELTELQGQPQWADAERARLASAVWHFTADGTFTFDLPDSARPLYPLHGTYTVTGSRVTLLANGASRVGTTGLTTAQLTGTIDLATPTTADLHLLTQASTSVVVDDNPYSSRNTSEYQATLVLAA